MSGRKTKTGIVALERTYEACPVVTFQFPGQTAAGSLLVTLTLCEWQSIARQIADAATVLRR
jgi:hypothetical protein